ncbi:hypothetical protein DSM112329_01406 [Paraconexibacter sp. AEG42_29]|uniref:Uncharacterized protein n=1 Tax=Paraconexibacter sp. AEG42_29 TaxID=2997339 RepID=A0AAU7ASU3_9ACTN
MRRHSQLSSSLDEQTTDAEGAASIAVSVKAGDVLLLRVSQRSNSVAGTFRLAVSAAPPPLSFPGARLPRAGSPRPSTRSCVRAASSPSGWSRAAGTASRSPR